MPENKEILQAFMLLRQYQMVNIICCPQFTSIDRTMRNERCHLLINVTARGEYQAYFGKDLAKVNADLNNRRIKLAAIRVSMQNSWTGRFNRFKPKSINEEEYLKKKKAHGDEFLYDLIQRRLEREKKRQDKAVTNKNIGVIEPISQEFEGFGEANTPYPRGMEEVDDGRSLD